MSYESKNIFPASTRIADVRAFVKLLGYEKIGEWKHEDRKFEDYGWFERKDYKSWSGVELAIYKSDDGALAVSTRTTISRSYYDLEHQNDTISSLYKRFSGTFRTDEGSRRYMRVEAGSPPPAASGCHLAFARFGSNLIRAKRYLEVNAATPAQKSDALLAQLGMDHKTLSCNMLVSFFVSIVEDYLKSYFIALLRYSEKKEGLLRSARLQSDQLIRISNHEISVEEALAESMSFQRIASACKNIASIDTALNIAGVLRKPYRRRLKSFFDQLTELVEIRHKFVHRAELDRSLRYSSVEQILFDLDVAITRVQRRIFQEYDWPYEKTWSIGREPRTSRSKRRVQSG